ncbi:MAG: mucoidy inhibitor MuiA family protein [Thermoproteota archaeon]
MKKSNLSMKRFLIILMLCVFTAVNNLSAGEIERVLLTPQAATLWVKETIPIHPDATISFEIPPQALVETLGVKVLEPQGVSITTVSDEWLEKRPEKEVGELMEKIKAVERERDVLRTTVDIVNTEIEAWKQQSRKRQNQLQDVVSIVEEAGRRLEDLHKRLLQANYDLKAKDEELEVLNKRLNEMTGAKKKVRRISCRLEGLSEDAKSATIRYWFTMNEAGWRPIYRFELFPSEGRLLFVWDAEVIQRSGVEWSNVDTTLATLDLKTSINPPELPPWFIEPVPRMVKRHKGDAVMMAESASPLSAVAESESPHEEKNSFILYHLGRRDISSGRAVRFRVIAREWKPQVYYLLRPFVSSWAFVQAKVDFDDSFQVPQGDGLFFLDGTFVSRTPVSIQGMSQIFSFGTDPMVSSKLVVEERQSGRKGLLKGRQRFTWKWRHEIENSHSFPVTLRLEERRPQARDERIEVKFTEVPSLKEADECSPDRWCWEVNVKEREKKVLRFAVEVEAPEDMEIIPGW